MSAALIRGELGGQPALAIAYGAVCALAVATDAEPDRLLWGALLAAVRVRPAWLLTTTLTPAAIEVPADLAEAAAAAIDAGSIKVLRHHLVRPSARQLRTMLTEFDYFAMAPQSLLVVDCGELWFSRSSRPGRVPLIELLRQWAQRHQVAVLLLFHASGRGKRDRATELLGFASQLAGIGRITRRGPASLSCNLLYWFAAASVVTDATLLLYTGSDGLLQAEAPAPGPAQRHSALDSATVIVLRSALAGSGGAPPHWLLCDTLEDVIDTCGGAQAATVILAFERTTPQDALMQAVFHLRQTAGNQLKIIVREILVRMRYNEDALIARLGASLIVPMEVSYARFLSMMEMVQNQTFSGVLPVTYDHALAEGLPQEAAGYLPPPAFAAAVTEALARSRALAIDNVLVRLTLVNGLTPLDVMRHCSVKRAGDIFSCDRKTMLVFLFACRENDATQTLERIFALPVGELFSSEHRYIANLAAQSAIEDFGQRAAGGRLPDLSVELQAIMALRAPLAPAPQMTSSGAVEMTTRRAPPVPPQRTPLRLRAVAAEPGGGRP